jgi:hypothetical protein
MEQDSRYQSAKKRVEEIKGFYMHPGVYLIFSLAMFAINEIATRIGFGSTGRYWFGVWASLSTRSWW